MDSTILSGIFSSTSIDISIMDFFVCLLTAICLGVFLAKIYEYKTKCSKGFVATLALLPIAVCTVIIMVNGNIGTGVAVAGAFSLVRFRSVPGTAKEIGAIFLSMCTGLTIGMGYIAFAVIFALVAGGFTFVLTSINFGEKKDNSRMLTITIPESLNFSNAFDDIFKKYTVNTTLVATKTTNMGSFFKLTYEIELKNIEEKKTFIDDLRCRNGNLDIVITRADTSMRGL